MELFIGAMLKGLDEGLPDMIPPLKFPILWNKLFKRIRYLDLPSSMGLNEIGRISGAGTLSLSTAER
jgi:hypothetical protein